MMGTGVPESRISGCVILRKGSRGSVYYLKYRLADGRQVKRRLGEAWTQRGRAPAGYYTARTAAEALQAVLTDARRGTLAGMTTIDAKFADASAEWLRYVQHDRDVKPSTLFDYRHMVTRLNRTYGNVPLAQISAEDIERWRAGLSCSNRTAQKYLIVLNGIFKRAMKVYKLASNPMTLVERPRVRHSSDIDVLSAAEVRALVRATPTELHKTLFLTAAFTGLRMGELLALRWGEVDFAAETIRVVRSFTTGGESSPKSGKPRSVPMVVEVATALARLGQRERFTSDEDLVFAGAAGGHLDSKEVRAIYKAALTDAGLRNLRFHDLRHTFGTRAVNKAESILELKEWMGHANVQTTMRYLHYRSKAGAARRLTEAFADETSQDSPATANAPVAAAESDPELGTELGTKVSTSEAI
jgi:integrase